MHKAVLRHRAIIQSVALFLAAFSCTADPVRLVTRVDHELLFPASRLTTKSFSGPTNSASKFMTAAAGPASLHGGSVSLITTQSWVGRFNTHPSAAVYVRGLTTDPSGNVLVTADSLTPGGSSDIAVLKWSSDGTPLWTNRYAGFGNSTDYAGYVATDSACNVFAAAMANSPGNGPEMILLKYSPEGTPLWTNRFNTTGTNYDHPAGLAVDSDGNAYVLTTHFREQWPDPDPGIILIKYDPSGRCLWTNSYSGPMQYDTAIALVLDHENNPVLCANSDQPTVGTDYLVLKYSGGGLPLWTNLYHRGFSDYPRSITVDNSNAIIVTGESGTFCPTIKYSKEGIPLWTNLFAGSTYSGGGVPQITCDPAGNLFVSLGAPITNGLPTVFPLLKLTPAGTPVFTNYYTTAGTTNLQGGSAGWFTTASADSAGNLYATGYSVGAANTNVDYLTVKIEALSRPVWTNRYDGCSRADYTGALSVDLEGNVYIAGQSDGPYGQAGMALIKYSDNLSYTPPAGYIGQDTFSAAFADQYGLRITNTVEVTILPLPTLVPTPSNSGGPIRFQLNAVMPGETCILFASTNLISWTPVLTNAAAEPDPVLTVPEPASNEPHFYRAAVR